MTLPSDTAPVLLEPVVLELLASRICHDLISPVGAIHNGVEFMEEMGPESSAEALQLINHSALQAAARLQIFRLAYGAGGRDPNVKPADVKKTFASLVDADGKIRQDWDPKALKTESLPPGFCKLLAGLLIMAQECLPKGGTISVANRSDWEIVVTAAGDGANIRPGVAEAINLSIKAADLDPRLVHPYILAILARHYGYAMSIESQAGRVTSILSILNAPL